MTSWRHIIESKRYRTYCYREISLYYIILFRFKFEFSTFIVKKDFDLKYSFDSKTNNNNEKKNRRIEQFDNRHYYRYENFLFLLQETCIEITTKSKIKNQKTTVEIFHTFHIFRSRFKRFNKHNYNRNDFFLCID